MIHMCLFLFIVNACKSVISDQDIELDFLENRSNSTDVQINEILSDMVELNTVIDKLGKESTGIAHTKAYVVPLVDSQDPR